MIGIIIESIYKEFKYKCTKTFITNPVIQV